MATTALGRLTLDLAVRLSDFTAGMDQAARQTAERTREMGESVNRFREGLVESLSGTPIGGAIDSLNSRLSSITEAFGDNGIAGAAKMGAAAIIGSVAAMGAGLVALSVEAAKADAQLSVMAAKANITTTQLQILSSAASQLGIEQEQLADILKDTQEKLGEYSATGGGGAADFFEALENNTKMSKEQLREFSKELSRVDGAEAIQMIKDKMDALNVTSQEQLFLMESLGSDLNNLMPIFENGGTNLALYGEALKDAGVIKTEEAIQQSRILAAQTGAAQIRFEGLKNQLVGHMTPAINSVSEYFSKGSNSAKGFGNSAISVGNIISGVAKAIIGFASVVNIAIIGFQGLMDQFFALGQAGTAFLNADGFLAKIQSLEDSGERFRAAGRATATQIANEMERAANAINNTGRGAALSRRLDPIEQTLYDLSGKKEAGSGLKINTKDKEDNDKALEANTKALEKANADAKKKASDSAKSMELLKTYVVGGKSFDTIKAGMYGAARAGRPLGHQGLDLSTPKGTQVFAPEAGRYTFANTPNSGTGRMAILEGDSGKKYRFLHMDSTSIPSGTRVEQGSPIAKTGNSGKKANGAGYDTHLHIEVFDSQGKRLNPTNMQVNGKVKVNASLASSYDKIASDREREQAEAERIAEAARKLAGQNILEATLAQSAKIDLEAKKAVEEANRTLIDRPKDLATVIASIERDRVLAHKELDAKVMKPFLTKENEIQLDYEDRLIESITAYGEGSALQIKASENALIERDKRLAELREATLLPFRSEREQLAQELSDDIKDIEAIHGIGSDTANKATDFLKARYEIKIKELDYLAGETQRQIAILSQNIGLSTKQATEQLLDNQAKASMKPLDFERYSLNANWQRDRNTQQGAYEDREKEINAVDNKGDFLYQAEDRNILLEEAHKEHLARMALLDDEYATKSNDLAKSSAMAKLDLEQTNVEALGSLAGVLFGQQSAAARAAFLVSKAYTLQKILLDKGAAISSAWANTNGSVWAKAAAAAQAAIANGAAADIVNQVVMPSLGGIAHGGLDYVPSESTYLLDKGERVLSPNQNKDLTNFLSKGSSSTGETNITINVDNNGGTNMSVDNASEVSKQMAVQIKNTVYAVLRQEKRQGGML